MDEYVLDLDNDARQALALLWDAAPTVAEQVENGTCGLYVIDRGIFFGVDIRPGNAYRVIVNIREHTVEHDGIVL